MLFAHKIVHKIHKKQPRNILLKDKFIHFINKQLNYENDKENGKDERCIPIN